MMKVKMTYQLLLEILLNKYLGSFTDKVEFCPVLHLQNITGHPQSSSSE